MTSAIVGTTKFIRHRSQVMLLTAKMYHSGLDATNYYIMDAKRCSWQVVLYESSANSAFISKVDINYGRSDHPLPVTGLMCAAIGIKDSDPKTAEVVSLSMERIRTMTNSDQRLQTLTADIYYSIISLGRIFFMLLTFVMVSNLTWLNPSTNFFSLNNQILLINSPRILRLHGDELPADWFSLQYLYVCRSPAIL